MDSAEKDKMIQLLSSLKSYINEVQTAQKHYNDAAETYCTTVNRDNLSDILKNGIEQILSGSDDQLGIEAIIKKTAALEERILGDLYAFFQWEEKEG